MRWPQLYLLDQKEWRHSIYFGVFWIDVSTKELETFETFAIQQKNTLWETIVKVLKIFWNFVCKYFIKTILKIVVEKCAHFLQPINRIWPVEMKQSVRDLFHENHVAMSVEFKAWTDIIRVRLELNLDLDLGDDMSNFDGFNNITYQCLDRKLSVKTKTLKTRWQLLPKKNAFSLMTSRKERS